MEVLRFSQFGFEYMIIRAVWPRKSVLSAHLASKIRLFGLFGLENPRFRPLASKIYIFGPFGLENLLFQPVWPPNRHGTGHGGARSPHLQRWFPLGPRSQVPVYMGIIYNLSLAGRERRWMGLSASFWYFWVSLSMEICGNLRKSTKFHGNTWAEMLSFSSIFRDKCWVSVQIFEMS